MGAGHKRSKLEIAQRRAWRFYRGWRDEGGSFSPALKDQVFVTRLGWDHLLNPRKRRTTAEKIRRLDTLPLARKLLEVSTTHQERRVDKTRGITYWGFVANMDGKQLKVVVSAKNKKKYFLSVIVVK